MSSLVNAIKAHAAAMDGQAAVLRYGTVASIDAARHRVKITLQPEGTITSWLPVLTTAAGAGWGLAMMPTAGMQVALMGTHGSNSDLIVLGAVHSDVDAPAKAANAIGASGTKSTGQVAPVAGELVAVHQSGSVLRLCDDGTVYIRGNVGIDGTLRVNGDVYDQHGSLDRLRGNYDAHTHNYLPGPGALTPTTTTSNVDPE